MDDIVHGVYRALDVGGFEVFKLGNAHPMPIDYMVNTLAHALQEPVRKKFVPTPAAEMLLTHADLTKSRQLLGYSPKVTFEEGIRRFVEWLNSRR